MDLICEKLTNNNGVEVRLLNLGAALIGVSVPEPGGRRAELTLGYENDEDYFGDIYFFGSTPGRFANRIGGSRFSLNGNVYELPPNEGANHLHGGADGFAKKLWETKSEEGRVIFTYHSPDGENGYPGAMTASAAYSLDDENELAIEYTATSDADTVVNLTNHAYFNLAGSTDKILDHTLRLNAGAYVVTDEENIPTGEIRQTAGIPMDFSAPARLGDAIGSGYEAIAYTGGLDSCFVLNGTGLRDTAVLTDPASGRTLEVMTDLPGLQIYTGHGVKDGTMGRGGLAYGPFSGVCLEAQHLPDAPNRPDFPSAVLAKGETFAATIIFRFGLNI